MYKLHRRHIKNICNGKCSSDPLLRQLVVEGFLLHEGKDVSINVDYMLCAYVYNYVLESKHLSNRNLFSCGSDVCNITQNIPIYWFYRYWDGVGFYVGVRLEDIIRVLLNTKDNPKYIWHTSIEKIFRLYISYLRTALKRDGIKESYFYRGITELKRYDKDTFYKVIGKIFNNYLKLRANGNYRKNGSTRKY